MRTVETSERAIGELRTAAMGIAAAELIGVIHRARRDFLTDARSVLDRPALAVATTPAVAASIDALHVADAALIGCAQRCPGAAVAAYAAAHAANHAARLADQDARRLARTGNYPLRRRLTMRELDLIEEARASLELAAATTERMLALAHRRRAVDIVDRLGIAVPEALSPAWTNLLSDAVCGTDRP